MTYELVFYRHSAREREQHDFLSEALSSALGYHLSGEGWCKEIINERGETIVNHAGLMAHYIKSDD